MILSFEPPISVTVINRMTIAVFSQVIVIERDNFRQRYSGYSKTEAISKFRKYCKQQKSQKA